MADLAEKLLTIPATTMRRLNAEASISLNGWGGHTVASLTKISK